MKLSNHGVPVYTISGSSVSILLESLVTTYLCRLSFRRCLRLQLRHHFSNLLTAFGQTARPLPEWLARKRKRSLKADNEYANRIELLQDFEFEEASQCVRCSDDGDWVVSTGTCMHYQDSVCHIRQCLAPTSILLRAYRDLQTPDTYPLPPTSIFILRSTYNLLEYYVRPLVI